MSENKFISLSASCGLLLFAGIVVSGTQWRVASIENSIFNRQRNAAAKQLAELQATQTQTNEALKSRDLQIQSEAELKGKYAALLTDLVELAAVDVDARAITQKWKIQQQGAPDVGGDDAKLQNPAVKAPAEVPRAKPAPAGG